MPQDCGSWPQDFGWWFLDLSTQTHCFECIWQSYPPSYSWVAQPLPLIDVVELENWKDAYIVVGFENCPYMVELGTRKIVLGTRVDYPFVIRRMKHEHQVDCSKKHRLDWISILDCNSHDIVHLGLDF